MIEQGFNWAASTVKEMTNFFEPKVENLEPKLDKKKSPDSSRKKTNEERFNKKRKWKDSDSSIVEFCTESSLSFKPVVRKYYVLNGIRNHIADNYKDLKSMVNKHKKK